MQTLLRLMFGHYGRAVGVVFMVAAAWFYWWMRPEKPLRQLRVPLAINTQLWSVMTTFAPTVYRERLVMDFGLGNLDGTPFQGLFEVDLAGGKLNEVKSTSAVGASATSSDLSSVAWSDEQGTIHVAGLVAGARSFTIPRLPNHRQIPKDNRQDTASVITHSWVHPNHQYHLDYSPDGRYLAVSLRIASGAEVWDVHNGQKVIDAPRATGTPAFSVNCKHVAFASAEKPGAVTILEIATARTTVEIDVGPARVPLNCLAMCPDGRIVTASSSIDLKQVDIGFWSPSSPDIHDNVTFPFQLPIAGFPVLLRFANDGRFLLVQNMIGRCEVIDTTAKPPTLVPKLSGNEVALDPTGRKVAVCESSTKSFNLISSENHAPVLKITGNKDVSPIWPRFSPDGRYLGVTMMQLRPFESTLARWIRLWLKTPNVLDTQLTTLVLSTEQAQVIRRVPADGIVAWPADGESFWTKRHEQHPVTPALIYERWPMFAPHAPWWLYALTAAGVLFIFYDFRRGRADASAKRR